MDTGKLIGGMLLVGATIAVWMWPDAEKSAPEAEPIRPIRSALVDSKVQMPNLSFVGTVKAKESRTLTFKQKGRIQRIPVAKGQKLKKGEKIAWLDPLDFENELAKAEAAVKRDRLSFQRKSDAAKKNAISQEEVSQAEAQLKQSEAEFALAKRALAETVLVAPFDCTVADVPCDELDMVGAGIPIAAIQDLSTIKVDVVYPEALVIRAKGIRSRTGSCDDTVRIAFDSMPGRSYPAKFVEYTGLADKKTQTYLATYEVSAPDDLLLLPGMSATLLVQGDAYTYEGVKTSLSVPESAIGVDVTGRHFVWKLTETEEKGVYAAHKTMVEMAANAGARPEIIAGLGEGDRVATAGVTVLTEGRKVSLMKE